MNKPNCPNCGSDQLYSHGTTGKAKHQRWKCKNCKKTFGGDRTDKGGKPKTQTICYCGKPAHVKNLCNYHYQVMRKKLTVK